MKVEASATSVKIVIIGDMSVGKTCVTYRYVEGTYSDVFANTIGLAYSYKEVEIDGKKIGLQLWDTAGQERYRSLVKTYFRGTHGALVFYDITSRESFGRVGYWMDSLSAEGVDFKSVILVGNKVDLAEGRQVTAEEGRECARRFGVPFFETSAKDGTCVEDVFGLVVRKIVENNPRIFEERRDVCRGRVRAGG